MNGFLHMRFPFEENKGIMKQDHSTRALVCTVDEYTTFPLIIIIIFPGKHKYELLSDDVFECRGKLDNSAQDAR